MKNTEKKYGELRGKTVVITGGTSGEGGSNPIFS